MAIHIKFVLWSSCIPTYTNWSSEVIAMLYSSACFRRRGSRYRCTFFLRMTIYHRSWLAANTLINNGCKKLPRILNSRFISVSFSLVNALQAFYMANRFIADNDHMAQLLKEDAQVQQPNSIGLLLDQVKAYGRVHLRLCICFRQIWHIRWWSAESNSVLFYRYCLQVNGFLSKTVRQKCGMRQGDPNCHQYCSA